MIHFRSVSALLLVLGLLAAGRSARAQAPLVADAVELADLAHRLTDAGTLSLGPHALLMAAQIALEHPARRLTAIPNDQRTTSTGDTLPAFDVEALLARAEAMAASDSTMLTLIARLRLRLRGTSRGVLSGPRLGTYSIAGGGTHEFQLDFAPGEPAVVRVRASSATALSCDVLNERGEVLREDLATSYCVLNFRPSSSGGGVIRIRIRSAAALPSGYVLITN